MRAKQLGDQYLAAVVLDIAFIQQAILNFPGRPDRKSPLRSRMPAELGANLLDQRLLFGCAFGGFELGEQVLDLAVVSLQQGDGV